jgi:hypothetical protein
MDYFFEMDPDHTIYDTLIWDFLKRVETLFDLEQGTFDNINYKNLPDPSPNDHDQLKTILYEGRYANYKFPKEIMDFSFYRDCITNPEKIYSKGENPVFEDYVFSFVSCLKQFDAMWSLSIEETEIGYLGYCFGNLPENVHREKEAELFDLFIRSIDNQFPNLRNEKNFDKIKEMFSLGLKELEENLAVQIKNRHPYPSYIQELMDKGCIMPDGKMVVRGIDDVAQALNTIVPVNKRILSQFKQGEKGKEGLDFSDKTLSEAADRVRNSKP